ncbi:MAG: GntR family transcriptional regulator [Granulosicoccus sp.]
MSLNPASPLPLYQQLATRLMADIDAGVYAVAARIPSENELAERFCIGRPTVRQATDLLIRQGRLQRRRGSGTFVLPARERLDLFSLAGTSAALQEQAGEKAMSAEVELLGSPVEEERERRTMIRIDRRTRVDADPVSVERLWFDADVFAGLQHESLAGRSLATLVRERFHLEPSSADQSFTICHANAEQAELLACSLDMALLKVERRLNFDVLREQADAIHAEIICRTDRFEFTQTLYPSMDTSSSIANTQ